VNELEEEENEKEDEKRNEGHSEKDSSELESDSESSRSDSEEARRIAIEGIKQRQRGEQKKRSRRKAKKKKTSLASFLVDAYCTSDGKQVGEKVRCVLHFHASCPSGIFTKYKSGNILDHWREYHPKSFEVCFSCFANSFIS